MYEVLEEDYDPKLTKEERRARRKAKVLLQYEAAKAEEETLTSVLNVHKAKVCEVYLTTSYQLANQLTLYPSGGISFKTAR